MEDSAKNPDVSATSANGVVAAHPPDTSPAKAQEACVHPDTEHAKKKTRRTTGLKVFDVLLYPLITNFGVFAMSVAATYLTTRGGDLNAAGHLKYGKIGKFFHDRGTWLEGKFMKMGMNKGQADMSKMVAFSFVDGSLMAPVIKVFEDHREQIGRSIDKSLGTEPEDESVYAAEPKQSWLSVLGGRLATVSIVVPTAVALDKTGLNDRLFTQPGQKLGERLAASPKWAKLLGKLDIRELGRIGLFEAFYTSVCTAGIYVNSRMIARATHKKQEDHPCPPVAPSSGTAAPQDATTSQDQGTSAIVSSLPTTTQPVIRSSKKTPEVPAQSFTGRIDAEAPTERTRV